MLGEVVRKEGLLRLTTPAGRVARAGLRYGAGVEFANQLVVAVYGKVYRFHTVVSSYASELQ